MNKPSPIITRLAPLKKNSFDKAKRTVEAVISTGADVNRFDMHGKVIERLRPKGKWPDRVVVLDTHNRNSMDAVLGYADNIRSVGDEVHATIHLSRNNPKAERIALDLEDGAIFGISVGYSIDEVRESKEGDVRVKTVTGLTLMELSFCPLPADSGAQTRTGDTTMPEANIETVDRSATNASIRALTKVAGLDDTFANLHIDAGATLDAVREAAFAAMTERGITTRTITSTAHNDQTLDNPEVRVRAMGEALYARSVRDHKLSDASKPFAGMTMVDIARDCLRERGYSTTGLSPNQIVTRSLHTTSDFAMILGDTVGRTMRQAYEAAPSGLKPVARASTMPDFRERMRLSVSQFSKLEKVNENGEFKRGTFLETGETFRLYTIGKIFGITRQAMVNDQLSVFQDVPAMLGTAAANSEAQALVDLLIANPAGPLMSDNKRLFHVDHGNLAASGAPPSEATLTAARLAMRGQKDASGQLIAVSPKYLVIPPALETTVEKLLTTLAATTTGEVNPFAGKLTAIVEPRLVSATAWYMVADPAQLEGLEYAHLEGEPGPQIETRAGFDVDGVESRIRLDFGAGFLEWRSWFKNPG